MPTDYDKICCSEAAMEGSEQGNQPQATLAARTAKALIHCTHEERSHTAAGCDGNDKYRQMVNSNQIDQVVSSCRDT